jgi:hypothetical protein
MIRKLLLVGMLLAFAGTAHAQGAFGDPNAWSGVPGEVPPALQERLQPGSTYHGNLSANPFDPNSTSNPYGRYGSPLSPDSINNPYGRYGSPYSPDSPNNPYGHGLPLGGENDR